MEVSGERVDGVDADIHVEVRDECEEFPLLGCAVYSAQYTLQNPVHVILLLLQRAQSDRG